ncbi:MAG: ABC transporter permease [Bacteroidia bacterium]
MRSLQFGAYDNMIGNVVGSYMGYVQIHQNGYWEDKRIDKALEYERLDSIKDIDGVVQIHERIESFALANFNDRSKPVAIMGLDPDEEANHIQLDKRLIQGDYISSENQGLMLSKFLFEWMDVKIGDSISLLGQGYHGSIAAGNYPVVGVVDLKTPELNKRTIIMNRELAEDLYDLYGLVTTVVVHTNSKDWKRVQTKVNENLGDEFEVMNWKEMLPELIQLIRADKAGGTVVLIILYLIMAFGLFGTVLMSAEERTFEYGVLIAVGMKRHQLYRTHLLESLMISLLGLGVGAVLSLPLVTWFNIHPIRMGGDVQRIAERFGFEAVLPTSIDPKIFITQLLILFVVVLLVNSYVFFKIKNLRPVAAMNS